MSTAIHVSIRQTWRPPNMNTLKNNPCYSLVHNPKSPLGCKAKSAPKRSPTDSRTRNSSEVFVRRRGGGRCCVYAKYVSATRYSSLLSSKVHSPPFSSVGPRPFGRECLQCQSEISCCSTSRRDRWDLPTIYPANVCRVVLHASFSI